LNGSKELDMMRYARYFPVLVVFAAMLFASLPACAQQKNDPKAESIVRSIDDRQNLEGLDITSQFTLVQKREGETDRVLKLDIYRRDAAEVFTIIFRYPDSEKGKGYLRKGDDLYFYLPSTREFVYRNRKDDIGSTDVRTDLFAKPRTLEQYYVTLAGREKVSQWDCDVVRLDAKSLDVSFPVQKWYVRQTDGLPVKIENFAVSQQLLRTFYFISWQEIAGGKVIVTKLLAVDALEKGQKTFLTNENVVKNKIAEYVFTKAYLEEQSR
jgi:outer membrane lipoprotein-sorting protein